MKYYFNEGTKKYHIEGLCSYNSKYYRKFDSERELMEYVGDMLCYVRHVRKIEIRNER